MFPQTLPNDTREIHDFMAGIGAHDVADAKDVRLDNIEVTRLSFRAPQYLTEQPIATWWQGRDQGGRDNQLQYAYEHWTDDLATKLSPSTITDEVLFQTVRTFDILDRAASLLVAAGHPRASLANTIALYAACGQVWDLGADADAEELYRCAELLGIFELTPEERLDAAVRLVPVRELTGLLAMGTPYLLIKELYPFPED